MPEVAARAHVESLLPVVEEALDNAKVTLEDVAGFCATNRPGLVGALSVGVSGAKSFALYYDRPWLGIHHLEGHIWSILGSNPNVKPNFMCLIVSGGHTELVLVSGFGKYELVGQTVDDAAGEAFDKSARCLGLPYPGGKLLEELATNGNPGAYKLPQANLAGFDFSLSGLKTAVWRQVDSEGATLRREDFAASVQESIIRPLVKQTFRAMESREISVLCVCGGVSANQKLRNEFQKEADRRGAELYFPPLELCTDNAAMIGIVGSLRFGLGLKSSFDEDVSSQADLPFL